MSITGVGIQSSYGVNSTNFAAYKNQQANTSTGQTSVGTTDTVSFSDTAKAMAAKIQTPSSPNNTVFSGYAENKMNATGVSTEQKDLFANVMQRAEEQVQNPEDAKSFLASLSSGELAAVQIVHGLGDKIDPQSLDMEGAFNLIHQPGDVKDFNDDGFVKIGKATTWIFPPPNAPQNVKDAWDETTANMSDSEKLRATIPFGPIPDIRQEGNSFVVIDHNDPDYNNPYKMGSSYQDRVATLLEGNEASKHLNTREVYEQTKELLETFLMSLEKHNCY